MSRVTVQTHVTLDGVIESPPEALLPYMSDEGRQATLELALASDALLLGRVTWLQLASAWREQTGAMAERLNAMPKYVVTSTLSSGDEWNNSELVTYGEVAALREQLDLLSYGCGALARDLLRDGLLDELHLNMTPVVAGRGNGCSTSPRGCWLSTWPTAAPTGPAPSVWSSGRRAARSTASTHGSALSACAAIASAGGATP